MQAIVSKAIAKLNYWIGQYQIKPLLSFALAMLMVLPATLAVSQPDQGISKAAAQWVNQNDDSQRPKTTREWNREARQTDDDAGERLKRIGEESVEAVKDFGSVFPDTAQRSASELKDNILN